MERPSVPRVSESEWEILSVLWKKSPLTAAEVFASLSGKAWKLNTVRTFLARLEKKGAVGAEEQAQAAKRFAPLVSKAACVRRESDSFLARVFEGGTAALLLHFAKSKRLSAAELAELEAILADKRKEGNR
ncbi:MAG: BlaI/MecI/CopY family transcriptional regulator [Gluconacetobacter diazotrophicus]|nr:BlaI/MecI/CopY family transcriptional regulator [Gluconacetobacter diazotrophicus]